MQARIASLLAVAGMLIGVSAAGRAQTPVGAPKDQPQTATELQLAKLQKAMEPYIAQARRTYPEAKQRYVSGLPPKFTFFVTVQIHDSLGHMEQSFISVDSIVGDRIFGRIASQIEFVRGFQRLQPYSLLERDMIDWLISHPDGSEEGNVVGKFIDTYRP